MAQQGAFGDMGAGYHPNIVSFKFVNNLPYFCYLLKKCFFDVVPTD